MPFITYQPPQPTFRHVIEQLGGYDLVCRFGTQKVYIVQLGPAGQLSSSLGPKQNTIFTVVSTTHPPPTHSKTFRVLSTAGGQDLVCRLHIYWWTIPQSWWSGTITGMVTNHPKEDPQPSKIYQKVVYYRIEIWHIDLTHNTKTRLQMP